MKDEYHKFRSQAARTMILISGTLCALMWRSLHHDTVTHSLSHATAKLTGGRVQLPGLVRHSFTPMTMVGVQVRALPPRCDRCAMPVRSLHSMCPCVPWQPGT